MLSLPAGRLQLDRPLTLRRSQTVLRGAGKGATTLFIPKSLSEVGGGGGGRNDGEERWGWRRRLAAQPGLGPEAAAPAQRRLLASQYSTSGGWIMAPGEHKTEELARVTSSEERGSYTVKVRREVEGQSKGEAGNCKQLRLPCVGLCSARRAAGAGVPAGLPPPPCLFCCLCLPPTNPSVLVPSLALPDCCCPPLLLCPLQVDRTTRLKPGQLVSVMYSEGGALSKEIMAGEGRTGSGSIG